MTDDIVVQVSNNDHEDDPMSPSSPRTVQQIPSSPPPSFRSRTSSTSSRRLLADDPVTSDAERTLNDAFDDGSDSDGEGNDGDDRQRLMRNNTIHAQSDLSTTQDSSRPEMPRTHTQLPTFTAAPRPTRFGASFSRSNDGVFANLDAKPEIGEKIEEQPPVSVSHCLVLFFTPLTTSTFSPTRLQQQMRLHLTGKL